MERIQNKVAWALVVALSLLVIAAVAGVAQGGPMDPTAPPGSTGKNVITSLPFNITEPGSYVLNGNLTCTACSAGEDGIHVNSDNVMIDLQGFELVGVPGALSGIEIFESNIEVRNGTIRDWPDAAVFGFGSGTAMAAVRLRGNGWGASVGSEARVSDCEVVDSTELGGIWVGDGSTITNCVSANNAGGPGFVAGIASTLENCVATGNGGRGIQVSHDSIVRGCTARNNGDAEIHSGSQVVIQDCVAEGSTGATQGPGDGIVVGFKSTVRNCSSTNNAGKGIVATGSSVAVEDCIVADNNGTGIELKEDSIVSSCSARNNGGHEIHVFPRSIVEDCIADGWTGSAKGPGIGIAAVLGNILVRNCTSQNNLDDGIWVGDSDNRIENNHVIANGSYGIELTGGSANNVVIGNNGRANTSGNFGNLGAASNQMEVITTTAGATNPWANISLP